MTKRYLEDFAVGQVFKSGRKRVDKDEISLLPGNTIRNRSISTRPLRGNRPLLGWRRAAGIPRR